MKDALGHGSDSRGAHADGVGRVGKYKFGAGPGTYKFNGTQVTIAQYNGPSGIKTTGVVGTLGQSVSELASIIKQHPGSDRHSQNVRRAAQLELMHRPVRERLAHGVM